MKRKLLQFNNTDLIYAAIGAVLYGFFDWAAHYLQIPSTAYIDVRPAVAIPMFLSVLRGPAVGFFSAFFGSMLGDRLAGYDFWFFWYLGTGIQGMLPGFLSLSGSEYRDVKRMIRIEIMVLLGVVLGMGLFSILEMWRTGTDFYTTLEIYFLPSFLTNTLWGLLLVPTFLLAYSIFKARPGR